MSVKLLVIGILHRTYQTQSNIKSLFKRHMKRCCKIYINIAQKNKVSCFYWEIIASLGLSATENVFIESMETINSSMQMERKRLFDYYEILVFLRQRFNSSI